MGLESRERREIVLEAAFERDSRAARQTRIGVLLAVYDFPMVGLGLRTIINEERDLEVLAEADSRESTLALLARTRPQVVITECLLLTGCIRKAIGTIEAIRQSSPESRILVLASENTREHFSLALKAGADGFLTREAQPAEVITALRCISRGQVYVSPEIVTRMMTAYFNKGQHDSMEDPYELLSEREKEVLLLVVAGLTNREIADIFHLSEQTVHNNRARLMEKLGFHDRVELLKYAIRRRLISVDDL